MRSEAALANGQNTEQKLVVFRLDRETYGIPISAVAEISQMQAITRVPRTPEFIEGIVNVRGNVLPIIDLRKRFGLALSEQTRDSRIIQVEVGEVHLGLIVDAVTEVLPIDMTAVEPPSPVIASIDTEFIKGVVKADDRLIILVDLQRVLNHREAQSLNEIA